jgi:hypothetical protein
MPESVEEPTDRPDPNLEEQTMGGEEPGPGASKMENLRRAEEQVRTQKKRSDDADPKGSVPDREE